jgi:hypothetical protein
MRQNDDLRDPACRMMYRAMQRAAYDMAKADFSEVTRRRAFQRALEHTKLAVARQQQAGEVVETAAHFDYAGLAILISDPGFTDVPEDVTSQLETWSDAPFKYEAWFDAPFTLWIDECAEALSKRNPMDV